MYGVAYGAVSRGESAKCGMWHAGGTRECGVSQIDLSQLDIFYGDLTANRALVYARLPRPDDGADWKLTGQIRGPRCRTAQTLPATSPLVDLGTGPTLLARALVPEPDNEHDPNAIGVWDDERRVQAGYVPAEIALELDAEEWQAVSLWEFFEDGSRGGLRVLLAPRDAWIGLPRP